MNEIKLTVKSWEVNRSGNVIITTHCPNCKMEETMGLDKFLKMPKYVRCYCCEQDLSTVDTVKDLTALRGAFR